MENKVLVGGCCSSRLILSPRHLVRPIHGDMFPIDFILIGFLFVFEKVFFNM